VYRQYTYSYQGESKSPVYHGGLQFSAHIACENCGNAIDNDNIAKFKKAVKAEKSGRYGDAAILYEDLDFLDKARTLRERGRVSTVRHQHVDINHLLEQVRQGNLVVPYKCPNCNAGITINKDTSVDRLTNCPYCGSALVVSDIERFLSSIL
jgi:DNA-directed RNA polymerase subunit RPC12/RpoP